MSASAARSRSITSADAGTLDLHDDGLARSQPRAMRLTDRRGRERFPVELGEHPLDGVAQLGFQHLADGLGVGSGGTRFCSFASSSEISGGMRSTRVAAIWPSLT